MKKRRDLALVFRYLIGSFMLLLVVVTIAQVVARFVFGQPLIWSDELARFVLIWMVFIGAAIVSYDDKHLSVEMFQQKMSPKVKLITTLIMRVLILAFLAVTVYSSIELVQVSHYTKSGALGIPMSYWRAASTIGCGLMFIFVVLRSVYDIIDFRNGTYTNSSLIEEEDE